MGIRHTIPFIYRASRYIRWITNSYSSSTNNTRTMHFIPSDRVLHRNLSRTLYIPNNPMRFRKKVKIRKRGKSRMQYFLGSRTGSGSHWFARRLSVCFLGKIVGGYTNETSHSSSSIPNEALRTRFC